MKLRLPVFLMTLVICQGQNEILDNGKNDILDNDKIENDLQSIKETLQPNVNMKCGSVIIYEEVVPPTIIESDEPTHIILQTLTSDMVQAELVDGEPDEAGEGARQKRSTGRVVRLCNRRRRRRCRYVIVVNGRNRY